MSADVLALAVRAADAYARIRGPWPRRCKSFFVERDALSRHKLVVRDADPGWHKNVVVFDPFPRKEMPMPTSPPTIDERMNNVLATGGLMGCLMALADRPESALTSVRVLFDKEGLATNSLLIRFAFLASPYRVTIEHLAEDEAPKE